MILLRDVEVAMQLDRSKAIYMYAAACTSYDFNALTSVVWKLWR
jgi:hypothetical protein